MKPFLRRFLPFLAAALMVCALAFGLELIAIHVSPPAAVLAGLALLSAPLALQSPTYCLGAHASAPVNTQRRPGERLYLPMAASAKIYQGTLFAKDSNGRAVRASDTAGLRVVGRAEETVDNSAGSAGDLSINGELGVFKFANSATNALTQADIGKHAVVEDDNTVASTATNKVNAGRVVAVDSDGVWVDTRYAYFGPRTVVTLTSTDGVAGAAADLTALKAEAEKIGDDIRALHASLFG